MAASSSTFRKGDSRNKGRPKGSTNKNTQAAKDALQMVYDNLGGAKRMLDWVKSDPQNERIFYGQIWPKLLPLTVGGDKESPIRHVIEWSK